jgi:hypothetical protein
MGCTIQYDILGLIATQHNDVQHFGFETLSIECSHAECCCCFSISQQGWGTSNNFYARKRALKLEEVHSVTIVLNQRILVIFYYFLPFFSPVPVQAATAGLKPETLG